MKFSAGWPVLRLAMGSVLSYLEVSTFEGYSFVQCAAVTSFIAALLVEVNC